jgi:hypothetical protein
MTVGNLDNTPPDPFTAYQFKSPTSIFMMKTLLGKIPCLALLLLSSVLTGCLVTPVSQSGGIGSVTVTNSNPQAIISAAQNVFPNYGYTYHNTRYPDSVSFDQASNMAANVMWGSYGQPQTLRVKVQITKIPGTTNYRISPKVYSVTSAGEVGFESKRPVASLWNTQFSSLFRQIANQSSGAGSY